MEALNKRGWGPSSQLIQSTTRNTYEENLVEWAIATHGMYESALGLDMFILQDILNLQKLISEHVIQIQH